MKPKLKILFTDFWSNFRPEQNWFTRVLSEVYDIELSENPDILIYSCFGFNFLKYNCPKIFYSGENMRPDFRFCDFALTFDHLDDPRHIRLPLYRWYTDEQLTASREQYTIESKKGFCSFVVSNTKEGKERIAFFEKLSERRTIASGDKFKNNVGGRVKDKLEFISQYKFNIAFENTSFPGYTTEKIVQPWMVGTVPIYWGNPLIEQEINPDCFINIHNFADLMKQ